MCRGCGLRHNSVVIDGIPTQVQNVNRTAQLGTLPIEMGPQSPAKFEPIRGFAMKETEEQMGMLKKENFSLKLRIYFLEEQMGKKNFSPESNADIYNALELKAEAEALKDELKSKEELLSQASEALSELEQQCQRQVDEITNNSVREKYQLKEQIQELQNEVDEFWSLTNQEERSESVEPELLNLCHSDSIGGLSDLCDLAFNTSTDDSTEDNAMFALPLNIQENDTTNPFTNPAPLHGLFSFVNDLDNHSTLVQQEMVHQNSRLEQNLVKKDESHEATVRVMERQVAKLENQVMELEEELAGKEDRSFILEGDLENLRRELEYKTEEVVTLQVEILDKDMKIENFSNELQSCNKSIEEKELQIQKLCEDLHNIEPEMEVTVQRIIERDRIIEGKIEQIEAQNKIIVEIQITLDEKKQQIGELEGNLIHAQHELSSVTHQLDNQTKENESILAELQDREYVVAQLKKNLKKQVHNVHNLGAELKESMDMLNKVQWEAQNCTSDDSVSDMAQEENEHLWAEIEQTKMEMARLQSNHEQTMANAQNTINELQKNLQDQCNDLCIIKEEHTKQMKECENSLQQKAKELIHLESTVLQVTNKIYNRDLELQNNINQIACLNEQLSETKEQLSEAKEQLSKAKEKLSEAKEKLCDNRCETDQLKNEIKFNNNSNQEQLSEAKEQLSEAKEKLSEAKEKLCANRCETDQLKNEIKFNNNLNQEHINVYNYADYRSIQSSEIGKVYSTTNTNEIKGKPSLLEIESNNTSQIKSGKASLEWQSFSDRPGPVSMSATNKDSQLLTVLCNEISDIRKDTQALRCERKALSEKVVDLQNLMKQQLPVYNEMKNTKPENNIKIELSDENKQKLHQIALSTNSQLAKLSQELQNLKNRINCQFKEVHIHSNQDMIVNYEEENVSLRKQLTASNEKCELLTTNLKEMSTCLYQVVSSEEQNMKYNTSPIINMEDNKAYTNIELNIDDDQYKEIIIDDNINNKTIPYMNTTVEMESLEENYTYSESTVPNHSIENLQQNQYTSCIGEDDNMTSREENNLNSSNDSEISINTSDFIVLTPLLKNINSLCQKLESATTKNDILKEQLQNAMTSQYNNYLHHEVIPEYQATVEELSETMRQLEESQALLSETTQRADILQQQHLVNLSHTEALELELHDMYKIRDENNMLLEEKEYLLQAAKQLLEERETHIEAMEVEFNEMYKSIDEKNTVLAEKEFSLLAAKQLLKEKEMLLQETSIQVNTNNEVIQGLSDEIEYLQKVACEKSGLEEQVNALQCSLQACESRLLQVNKERLAQVTETKHQQAQIAALSLQIQTLEDEQSITKEIISKNEVLTKQLEEEKTTVLTLLQENKILMESKYSLEEERARAKQTLEENAVLIKQLENERETMAFIQEEKKVLMSEKSNLQKDMQQIQNELATIDACAYNIQAQHSHDVQQYHIQHHNYQILREKHIKLQQKHSELQVKAEQLEDDLLCQIKSQKQLEIDQQQMKNLETHIKQLTTQVETERQLTSNLRQQLETIRSENPNCTLHHTNKTSQHSEENSHSELSPSEPPNENNPKASCLSQKGTKNKKRKVHWSDQTDCQQNEVNNSCTENTASTIERDTTSKRRMKSDSEPETGAISKLTLHEHDMKQASEMSVSTVSSCSFSVRKKNKRLHVPVFISNGQYG